MNTHALDDLISDLKEITFLDIKYGSTEKWKKVDSLYNLIQVARLEHSNEN